MESNRNALARKRQLGSAISEYLPIVAIIFTVGLQLAWRTFGEEIRLQGGTVSAELAGKPSSPGGASGPMESTGTVPSGGHSGTRGGSSGNAPHTGGEGGSSSPGGNSTGNNPGDHPGAGDDSNTRDDADPPPTDDAAGGNPGAGNVPGAGHDNTDNAAEDERAILAQASQFVEGLWEGFQTQFWGLIELALNPVESAKALYTLGEALVRDFPGTMAIIREELGSDLDALTGGNPYEVGRVIGENANPAALLRIASKLSSLAKITHTLDTGCSSFTAGTLVWTDKGRIPIESVRVGTRVLARSDSTYKDTYQPVTQLMQRQAERTLHISTGYDSFQTTDEHPFWLQGQGWTTASRLENGNVISAVRGDIVIRSIRPVARAATVYNLTVANDHTYFVANNGLWVHNSDNVICDLAARDTKRPDAAEALKELNTHEPGRQRSADELNLFHESLDRKPPYMPGTQVTDRVLTTGQKIYSIEFSEQKNPGLFASTKIYTDLVQARRELALTEGWKPNDGSSGGLVLREYTVIADLKVRDSTVGPQDPADLYPGGGQQLDVAMDSSVWLDKNSGWKTYLRKEKDTEGIIYDYPR